MGLAQAPVSQARSVLWKALTVTLAATARMKTRCIGSARNISASVLGWSQVGNPARRSLERSANVGGESEPDVVGGPLAIAVAQHGTKHIGHRFAYERSPVGG